MNRTRTPAPHSESERLTLALVVALALHAVVITQLHFDWINPPAPSKPPNLDVLLVQWASETPPEEADFLAQANQSGGGDNPTRERPSAPPPAEPAGQPEPRAEPAPDPRPRAEPTDQPVITQPAPAAEAAAADPNRERERSLPDAGELLQQTRRIAETSPDPQAERLVVPERPKRKFITANTREHLYASYMRAWVAKVERVGNMNYPEAARSRNLEGSLVLSVDVLADGSIERVRVMRSSGYELLDEAAVRIVRLAAPYAELPPEIRKETDILTITRTWQFSAGGRLR
jgi:protein TonB